jgi:DNA-binding PadR family transcriptional regulator
MWPFRFAMRRKRGLPHMMIYLLSSSPKNGVELMDGVESLTRGWWRPTPGSIYPLLKEMTDDGIVEKMDDGRYRLTAKGRDQAQGFIGPKPARPRSQVDNLSQMKSLVSYWEDVKASDQEEIGPYRAELEKIAKRLSALLKE